MPAEISFLLVPLAVIFGLLLGSFLNVCIYRVPRDLSVVVPRSFCPECGAQLAWYDNIPVISYLLLRGKCRHCAQRIGLRYPLVEITTAVSFGLTATLYGFTLPGLKWVVFEAILIVLFFTDLEERLLPDEFTLGGAAAGMLFSLATPLPLLFGALLLPDAGWRVQSLVSVVLAAILLSFTVWIVGILCTHVLKRDALGFGDVKLLAMIGAFLGVEQGVLAMVIATVGGSVVGLAYILWRRRDPRAYELPFGSFCCAGAALMPFISSSSHLSSAVR